METTTGKRYPENVGIRAIRLYVPLQYVDQTKLEETDGVQGKYTIGLGQQEDIASVALTATKLLLEDYKIDTRSIGFLAVGTETLIDKSKSVKTTLMQLFPDNHDIQGVDVKNACYGGTEAVLNAVDWVESRWKYERRFAIAVMADIALYEEGPARCTGGAGAVAILIGPDAPLVFDAPRGFHMEDGWDFYKPICGRVTEYPVVNGTQSLSVYLHSLEQCYTVYKRKAEQWSTETGLSMASFDALFFHSPFTKLVQKAVGRLGLLDLRAGHTAHLDSPTQLQALVASNESLDSSNAHKIATAATKSVFSKTCHPYLEINRRVGNIYTSSLIVQLLVYLARHPVEKLVGSRMLFFAYGSGSASGILSARILQNGDRLARMREVAAAAVQQLDDRLERSPQEYRAALLARERQLVGEVPSRPSSGTSGLRSGTYYLKEIGEKHVRSYDRHL